ncbi:2OG-Fe(II) oxygenase [Streptomyces sp. Rer75]|uniref:2OG-Fe(II)-dependent halogenase WelO5 family protein n=1 Tax=unclassified Streptomyces TaxID=2593676 RepID=UPI0015D033F4|nr:2OG-Fe(II) oxygenase [Streptomyces sp. Rer75]QLH25618.1 2OG-Fe(II) oxygenase [Streptomyces sp. Rer75]
MQKYAVDGNRGTAHGGATPVHTLFDVEVAEKLDGRRLNQVAAGVLGALHVRNFFTEQECRQVVAALAEDRMGQYDAAVVGLRIKKLGPAVFDFYNDGSVADAYWEQAKEAEQQRTRLLAGSDPYRLALDRLDAAWHGGATAATVGGRPLFAGMIREMGEGAGLHFDEVERELPGALDETPLCQLAFNCYLSLPESGGEVTVYRRRWRPADEDHRDGYWYQPHLVADEPRVTVSPCCGDAVFFDPRNYHRVHANEGGGRRVTLSFFIGVSSTGNLLLWS